MAVYSEADRHAKHVHLADQAFCIGPPAAKDSYLRKDRILQVNWSADCQELIVNWYHDCIMLTACQAVGTAMPTCHLMSELRLRKQSTQAYSRQHTTFHIHLESRLAFVVYLQSKPCCTGFSPSKACRQSAEMHVDRINLFAEATCNSNIQCPCHSTPPEAIEPILRRLKWGWMT